TQGIGEFVSVSNDGSFTSLVLDDSADTVARNVRIIGSGIFGLTADQVGFDPNDIQVLTIHAGSGGNTVDVQDTFKNASHGLTIVDTGNGTDLVNVLATTGQLILNGQNGFDTVNIGASAGGLFGMANINGEVDISNLGSRTALNVSDERLFTF